MSFLYEVGDKVVAKAPIWRHRDGLQVEAVVLDRKPKPPNRNFPYYQLRLRMPRGKLVEEWLTEHDILGLASEYKSPTHRYYQVLAHEPLLTFFRTPLPAPRWTSVRKTIIAAMAVHRTKAKDIIEILSIDGTEDAEQAALVKRLARAYEGDPSCVPMAALYDWYGDHFTLARKALHTHPAG